VALVPTQKAHTGRDQPHQRLIWPLVEQPHIGLGPVPPAYEIHIRAKFAALKAVPGNQVLAEIDTLYLGGEDMRNSIGSYLW